MPIAKIAWIVRLNLRETSEKRTINCHLKRDVWRCPDTVGRVTRPYGVLVFCPCYKTKNWPPGREVGQVGSLDALKTGVQLRCRSICDVVRQRYASRVRMIDASQFAQ
jgi:hypothetical protein